MTIQNTHPSSDSIKEILKALSNVTAKRKKNDFLLKKGAQVEVIIRIHIHTTGYENYCSIKSDSRTMSSSIYEILDNIRRVA